MTLIKRLHMHTTEGRINKIKKQDRWNITYGVQEEGREIIQQWREKRLRVRGARKAYHEFLVHTFDMDTFRSFFSNINFMVVVQIALAVVSVYIFQKMGIYFNLHVSLFVSPIVFPLAFSINTDFQRKEKVLEDLAIFKSSGMLWYFCMREWKSAAELDNDWIAAVHAKLKSLLFHLREYLLTCNPERRRMILRCMYEDFSDSNQLIERVRSSVLPANTAIVSRSIHLLNMMCLSFERLRVVREYRSPRSIRSFNKVFILFLPIILSPYFVYLGIESENVWQPYYMAILVAFVFSALQGTQDKLDDPFDGMSEDDINLDTIDEWTFSSLEHTMKRTFDVGRFKVTVDPKKDPVCKEQVRSPSIMRRPDTLDVADHRIGNVTSRRSSVTSPLARMSSVDPIDIKKKLAPMLEGMSGEERISRKSVYRRSSEVSEHSTSNLENNLSTIFEPHTVTSIESLGMNLPTHRKVTFEEDMLQSSLSHDQFLHRVERSTNPLDTPEDVINMNSTVTETLCSNTEGNEAIDMIGLQQNKYFSDDNSIDKPPEWIGMFHGNSSDPQHKSEVPDSSANRFCIKSSGNTGVQTNATVAPTNTSNIQTSDKAATQDPLRKPNSQTLSPPSKFHVKTVDKPPLIGSSGTSPKRKEMNLDSEIQPLLQSSEDITDDNSVTSHVPGVVFLNGLSDADSVDNSSLLVPLAKKDTGLGVFLDEDERTINIPLDEGAETRSLCDSNVNISNPVSPV